MYCVLQGLPSPCGRSNLNPKHEQVGEINRSSPDTTSSHFFSRNLEVYRMGQETEPVVSEFNNEDAETVKLQHDLQKLNALQYLLDEDALEELNSEVSVIKEDVTHIDK
jgi:hypothetical protein